jgi:hypothetical protein
MAEWRYSSTILSLALDGGEWSALPHEERAAGTQSIGGWADPRAGLDDVKKKKLLNLPGLKLQPAASLYTDYAIPTANLR